MFDGVFNKKKKEDSLNQFEIKINSTVWFRYIKYCGVNGNKIVRYFFIGDQKL